MPAARRAWPVWRPGERGRRRPGPWGTRSRRGATSAPAISIASRSMPKAMPPCGGAPISSARSRNENFGLGLLLGDPQQRGTPAAASPGGGFGSSRRRSRCRSGRGRTGGRGPPPGRRRSSRRTPARAPLNGLCAAFQRFSSGSHSNIGKPVTQSGFQPSSIRPRRSPRCSRSGPSTRTAASTASATSRIVSPSPAPTPATIAATSASRQELRDRRAHLAALAHLHPGDALAAPAAGELDQAVEVLAREIHRPAARRTRARPRRRRSPPGTP